MPEKKKVKKKKNIYSFKNVILNKKSYAKRFAGNNKELYDLLMDCFNANIETVKSHPSKETKNVIKKPYITFRINDYNESYLQKLIGALEKDHMIITFAFNHLGHKTVTFKTLKEDSSMFVEIQKILFGEVEETDKALLKVYTFIRNLKGVNTSIKLLFDEGEMRYYINTSDDNILEDLEKKLFPSLEEIDGSINVFK